jgi:hypothetical protein
MSSQCQDREYSGFAANDSQFQTVELILLPEIPLSHQLSQEACEAILSPLFEGSYVITSKP